MKINVIFFILLLVNKTKRFCGQWDKEKGSVPQKSEQYMRHKHKENVFAFLLLSVHFMFL